MTSKHDCGSSALRLLQKLCISHELAGSVDVRFVQEISEDVLAALASSSGDKESLAEYKTLYSASNVELEAMLKASEDNLLEGEHRVHKPVLDMVTDDDLATKANEA